MRRKLISTKCLLKGFHINYLIPDSFTTIFISQLAVILRTAGRASCLPVWNGPQLSALYWISIVEPEVAPLCGPVFYLSPGSAALRPGHGSARQGARKLPAAAAYADLQQGCHSTVLRGMTPALSGGRAQLRRGLKGNRRMDRAWTVFPLKRPFKESFDCGRVSRWQVTDFNFLFFPHLECLMCRVKKKKRSTAKSNGQKKFCCRLKCIVRNKGIVYWTLTS